MNKIQSMQEYFENYRKLKDSARELSDTINEQDLQIAVQRDRLHSMYRDISSMRKVITEMIENDLDPVEVTMRNDISELNGNLWRSDDVGYVTIDNTTGLLNPGSGYKLRTFAAPSSAAVPPPTRSTVGI
jgi:hypothetical protein